VQVDKTNDLNSTVPRAVPWLRRLFAGLSPRFDPGSVHVGFVVDKVALGRVFPRVLWVSPVNFIPPVLHYKEKRKNLIIFITGLHNKPQRCGASVTSATGPLKKNLRRHRPSGGGIIFTLHLCYVDA
jgi:hypothetical protein